MIFKAAPVLAFATLVVGSCFCCGENPGSNQQLLSLPVASEPPQGQQQYLMHGPTCPMEWEKPGPAGYSGELPQVGEVPFDWTDHPDAASYDVIVTQPDGTPVDYKSDTSSQKLYMENFKDSGLYYVEVAALGSSGEKLCSITLTFSKDAVNNGVGGGEEENPQQPPVVDSDPPVNNPPANNNPPVIVIIPIEPSPDIPR
jgi:hypothetical protein